MRCLRLVVFLFCAGAGYFSLGYSAPLFAQSPTEIVTVKPKPFDGTLVNPDIGFTTFQRFNGDSLNAGTKWTEGFPIEYQPFHGTLQNKDFPMTTIAYFRIYWRFVEPEQGVYNWAMLDKALQTAHARHQTLMLRIAPYGTGPESDVPEWYRKITGEVLRKAPGDGRHSSWYRPLPSSQPDWAPYEAQWMVDPMNMAYAHFFGDMIRALGARYDGDPDLNLIDISIVGPWGEGAGTPILTTHVMHSLMDSYLDSFHKTPLVVQPTDPKTDEYALSKANVGWRADCLGDMGGFNKKWNHMTDYYPEAVIEDGLHDAWKKAPVTMEACWVMQTWQDHGWDVHYIIDQAIKWHVSSFNAKSSAVPKDLWPEVNRWLQRMGYRFALRRFTYPAVIGPDRKIAFTSWWENDGDAPCYRKFPLALRLSNKQTSAVMITGADIRTWMPGDNLYNNSVFIPANLPDGDYQVSIAIVDPATRTPAIKLAIQGMGSDGWYNLGNVTVHQTLTADATEANSAPSHPSPAIQELHSVRKIRNTKKLKLRSGRIFNMRMKRYVFLPCLALGCLLPSGLANGQATTAPDSSQAVRGWEGSITIPTYKLGPADPNPAFPLVSKSPVYPYTMLDDLTDDRVPMTYRAIYLENKYLKITILPDLGGHVYSVYDKIDHREVLYRDNVIKYGLVGPRGAWISGGMEFSFPFAHTTDTVSSVNSVLRHNADGSATSVVGAVDWVSNMHWEISITLRPNTARVEEGVTLFNSTPRNHLYLFWTNTAVKATDDLQYIYPMRETIYDDPFAVAQSWPVWNGVDQSWYKNDPGAMAAFGRDVQRNFFGIYYHASNYGVVHVADFRQDPGKKIWTWGTSPVGKIWDHILSDNDGSYNEIQSGRFYTQGYREFMNPRRVENWTEYWYPVRGLDGGFVEATSQLAINAVYPADNSSKPQVKLLVSPVADVADATIVVKRGSNVLREFHHVNFAPLQTATYTIPVQNVEDAKKNLSVEILSSQGKSLLQWSAAGPIDGNPNLIPLAGKPIAKPIPINAQTPIEQLYLQGVFLEKTGNQLGALKFFDRVLAQDSGYVPALLKEAWYSYSAADFGKAESLIARAAERDTEDPYIAYTHGVIDRADGHYSLANDALWNAIHYGAAIAPGPTLAVSYVELGEIALRQGKPAQAIDLLKSAVGYNPDDAFALADLAVAERLSGNTHDAAQSSAEAVQKMPVLPYALAEQWQDEHAPGSKAGSSPKPSWTRIINADPQNFLAVASWYHSIGAWQSSDAILHLAEANPGAAESAPMINYYLASNARALGHEQQANAYAKKAAASTVTGTFPNRLEDIAVLREALQHNPADAQAQYSLGNFLFAKDQYDDAAALWEKALEDGFKNAVLLRNLGVYQWNVKHDLASAAGYYSQAIQISPADYRLYPDLDEIYTEQGDTAARAALFQNAPPAVLDQDTIRARRALFFLEQAKYDDAMALFANHRYKPWEGGVVMHNMFVFANIAQGKQALQNHHPEAAEASFRKALEYPDNLGTGRPAQPDTAEQMYWIGNALEAQGKSAEAKSAWQQAADQGKGKANVSAVYSALAYQKLGQDEAAQQLLQGCIQSAARLKPNAEDYFAAGTAEQYSNHADQARKYFRQALDLDPLFWQARIALKNLGS